VDEKTRGCLKQTAIGCGVLVFLAIAIPLILAVMMMSPLKRAIDVRHTLEQQHGAQDAYVPSADGVPAAGRIEIFLEVRRALTGPCADLTNAERQVQEIERLDEQDEIDRMEVMQQAFSMTKSMMGVGPVISRLYEIRNQSLLDTGMGLGEYTYIYVLAFHDQLVEPPEPDQLFGPGATNRRIRGALLQMLENQLSVLESEGWDEAETASLAAEIAAMEEDDKRIPWQEELPRSISKALAPYRTELDALYCRAMAPFDLMIHEAHGPAIESR
jgi:hypothetical protein